MGLLAAAAGVAGEGCRLILASLLFKALGSGVHPVEAEAGEADFISARRLLAALDDNPVYPQLYCTTTDSNFVFV